MGRRGADPCGPNNGVSVLRDIPSNWAYSWARSAPQRDRCAGESGPLMRTRWLNALWVGLAACGCAGSAWAGPDRSDLWTAAEGGADSRPTAQPQPPSVRRARLVDAMADDEMGAV